MRIGIIGAGAIGSVVGGLLTKAGRDVTLID
jgi:ketopantoate reductase